MYGSGSTPVADAWRRAKRRNAWLVALGTIALTAVVFWFSTLPSWRKLASRGWPTTRAHVEQTSRTSSDGREWIVAGTRVKIRFSFTPPDGVPREATQEVSIRWAHDHAIGEHGFVMPHDFLNGDRPWERIVCFYDPADPGRAVLERSLGHADVPALFPLLVILFGGLMFAAERRYADRADDVGVRSASRNGQRWRIEATNGVLIASSAPDLTPDAMLFTALVNWPAASVSVRPHPAALGAPIDVSMSFASRRGWRRRLRVRLMLGPYNGSGRARHARWSADVFDGRLEADHTIRASFALPRAGDLPAGVDDCWLRITARTTLGLPWSRTLWIALDDPAAR